ncbi:F-box/LRR-repeat protein 2 [Ditylenchus destructor]|nr:F-box/LRR-repeat protein 2 [Ditylenchus destructor]
MDLSKFKDYSFECVFCDPKLEKYLTITKEAMIRHCRSVHDVEEQIANKYYQESSTNINDLPNVNLAQILDKLPWKERLKIEQVCKQWQYVGKNLSWSNYKVFDIFRCQTWPSTRSMQFKPIFDRCGSYLRHLMLRHWHLEEVLYFIRMAPNLQHLSIKFVEMTSAHFQELSQIVPSLKSLALDVKLPGGEESFSDNQTGLIEFFKAMSCLEYLSLSMSKNVLFDNCSFVQFPPNLKYLALLGGIRTSRALPWIAKTCKHIRGLHLMSGVNENALQAVSQMKSLTYLAVRISDVDPSHFVYIFESLTELRAIEVTYFNDTVITAIAQHCIKLEHLSLLNIQGAEISAETHANILRLASLPNLCSLVITSASKFSKEQTTEFVNRVIANGKIQCIKMEVSYTPLEPEVLFQLLQRCKSIRSIGLNFGPIKPDFYLRIRQVVDEVDEEYRKESELHGMSHPMVEVKYNKKLAGNITTPYKWLRFKDQISLPAVFEKWKFGFLEAGKP